ncbi:FAD binding domain-containing protein [Phlyctema vagabunda]|uniref:FAD binding domain-containing protein n=1 Tax=Phlyctema vagabunda TaxID=108571 RepID=A0ABR4PNL3_9HELO
MSRPLAIRTLTTSHCIPEEPAGSPRSTAPSLSFSTTSIDSTEPDEPVRQRRASTRLISQNAADVQRIIGEPGTKLVSQCCGGGCCMALTKTDAQNFERVPLPDNDAFRALELKIGLIPTTLSSLAEIPSKTVEFVPLNAAKIPVPSPADSAISVTSSTTEGPNDETLEKERSMSIDFTPHPSDAPVEVDTKIHPPNFVQPHPPYNVYSAQIYSARELTRPGAEKRTYHFDLDVTDYPEELGVDFKVGGAIGIMAPNSAAMVEELLDLLSIPRFLRDRKVLLKTKSGRWPTVWGDEQARELITTRRDLLTWCSDIQSYPPTKPLLRLLADYASDPYEKKILLFLCSAEGQGTFCDFRTGPHITINQLLTAFPSSKPPLDDLLTQLQTLMPRFYSLSNDPHDNCVPANGCRRLIEIAVTVHESPSYKSELHPYGQRTGVGSGFFERQARAFLDAEARGEKPDLRIPMFKGLMANPLAKEFVSDGPMLLIGAGVGVAPFRGFVQRRLKNANCANKVWVLQGVRDSLLDELYSGEWGVHEDEVKKVVQSRKPTGSTTPDGRPVGKYVQDEVRAQADLVWFIINSLDGRVFVCGSSKGMGEGVEEALVDVAMEKGNLGREEAEKFWGLKKEAGQYIAETW